MSSARSQVQSHKDGQKGAELRRQPSAGSNLSADDNPKNQIAKSSIPGDDLDIFNAAFPSPLH
eukprot:10166726-Karenia_brevis.AAC.1